MSLDKEESLKPILEYAYQYGYTEANETVGKEYYEATYYRLLQLI
jgi:hypothetical protein